MRRRAAATRLASAALSVRGVPMLVALHLRVRDRAAAGEVLRGGGFTPLRLGDGALAIDARQAHGVSLVFEQGYVAPSEDEMIDVVGASCGERIAAGYYSGSLFTRIGKLELRVPRDREGCFSTELVERHQRSVQALGCPEKDLVQRVMRGEQHAHNLTDTTRWHMLVPSA